MHFLNIFSSRTYANRQANTLSRKTSLVSGKRESLLPERDSLFSKSDFLFLEVYSFLRIFAAVEHLEVTHLKADNSF